MQGYVILTENVDYSKQLHGVDIAAEQQQQKEQLIIWYLIIHSDIKILPSENIVLINKVIFSSVIYTFYTV